jgi:hypothetical protein
MRTVRTLAGSSASVNGEPPANRTPKAVVIQSSARASSSRADRSPAVRSRTPRHPARAWLTAWQTGSRR